MRRLAAKFWRTWMRRSASRAGLGWHGRPSLGEAALRPPVTISRCHWAEGADALMQAYHDTEWGVPQHDDRALFELLTLEGAQAGLSWRTVLVRRDAYRAAYHGFDIERVAAMTDAELENAAGRISPLIRNRLKIFSVRDNARAALAAAAQHGSLDRYSVVVRRATRRSATAGPSGRRCRRRRRFRMP